MAASAAGAAPVARRKGCCFAPLGASGGGACGLLTYAGGRWKLWGEQEAAVQAWHSDPSETYTAACFDRDGARLALGCGSGRVQVWDPLGGELVGPPAEAFRALGRGTSDCAVSCLAASQPQRASVFAACATMPDVLEVGMLDGTTRMRLAASKAGVCRLAASLAGAEWLLAAGAGAALKLWRVAELGGDGAPAPCAKLAASAGAASGLDLCCLGDRVLALCASGATQVSVFSCGADAAPAPGGKAGTLQAAVVLSCHERVDGARFCTAAAEKGARVQVVGYGVSFAAFWSFSADRAKGGSAAKALAPAFSVTADELGARVLAARHAPGEPGAALVVASGPLTQPAFARVCAPGAKGAEASVRPLGAAAPPAAPAGAGAAGGGPGKKAKPGRPAPGAPPAPPQPAVLGPRESRSSWPRAQRRSAADAAGHAEGEEDGAGAARKRPRLPEAPAPAPGGISIAPMVRQGLRAKDASSIDRVLETADRRIIDTTVAELTGPEAFDLIQECTSRLLSQPVHGQRTCSWIQRALLRHCAYLCSQPVLREGLRPLHEALRLRCASHGSLEALRGKLQVLRSFGQQALRQRQDEKETKGTPLLTYVEGDEDQEEGSSEEGAECAGDGSGVGSDDIFDEDIFDDDDESGP